MSVTEIDYMEYANDAAAQAAYVTDADIRAGIGILDEDMSDITDWTDDDRVSGVSSQVTFDSKSCMKLDSGADNSSYAIRYRDIGTFGTRTVFSMNIYFDDIGSSHGYNTFDIAIRNGLTLCSITFATDGIFVYSSAGGEVEIGTNLVALDTWQEWTFDINWSTKVVYTYLDKVYKGSASCDYTNAGTNGLVTLNQSGVNDNNHITYIDWIKVDNDFILQSYSESTIKTQGSYSLKGAASITDSLNKTLKKTFGTPLDLSGKNTLVFDIRASRTGSNIKIGLHDTGGVTTEVTPNIAAADTFQKVQADISGVADANKDAIDYMVITIVNADA